MIKQLDEAKKLTEEMRSPFEKFSDEMEHLNELLDAGVISMDTYARAANKAMESVASAMKQDIHLPNLAKMGSAEAVTTVQRLRVNADQGDRQQQIQRVPVHAA